MDPLLLGIDVGTGSAKGVLADPGGHTLVTASASYRYSSPQPGWAEQDPEDWWKAVAEVTRQLVGNKPAIAEQVRAVAVSGQGVAAVLLDSAGAPVRPAILWMDTRSSHEAHELRERSGDIITRVSGKSPAPYNVEPKLIWVRHHEPDTWRRAWKVLTTTGYVTFRLTGRPVMNYSDAGIQLAYDLVRNQWSSQLLRLMDLPSALYPELAPCHEVIGKVTSEAARLTGLREGTLVVAGGEDTSAAGLAVGVSSSEEGQLSVGTASTLYVPLVRPAADPRLLAFPHVVEGLILVGGSMISGGSAIDWAARLLAADHMKESAQPPPKLLEELTAEAEASGPGAGGIVFLPYLSGELQPINDGFARGVFFGLSLATRRGEMMRAVIEGIAFSIRHNLQTVQGLGAQARRLIAVGGPMRNRLLSQVIADMTGLPVEVMDERGGAALGGAMLAARGAGVITSYGDMIKAHARVAARHESRPDFTQRYLRGFDIYTELYPRLQDLFRRSAASPDAPRNARSVGSFDQF